MGSPWASWALNASEVPCRCLAQSSQPTADSRCALHSKRDPPPFWESLLSKQPILVFTYVPYVQWQEFQRLVLLPRQYRKRWSRWCRGSGPTETKKRHVAESSRRRRERYLAREELSEFCGLGTRRWESCMASLYIYSYEYIIPLTQQLSPSGRDQIVFGFCGIKNISE